MLTVRDTASEGKRERVRLHLSEDSHMDVCLPVDATPEMVEAFRDIGEAAARYLAATLDAKASS